MLCAGLLNQRCHCSVNINTALVASSRRRDSRSCSSSSMFSSGSSSGSSSSTVVVAVEVTEVFLGIDHVVVLSVWSLHVLPVSVGVSSGCSGFLPPLKHAC